MDGVRPQGVSRERPGAAPPFGAFRAGRFFVRRNLSPGLCYNTQGQCELDSGQQGMNPGLTL